MISAVYKNFIYSFHYLHDCTFACYLHRSPIFKDCVPVVQEASALIHSALDDPDVPLSPNELRWLGCNVYNLGCMSYQRDCFAEGVPLLTVACDELRVWCFAADTGEEIFTRVQEVILSNLQSVLE